MFTYFCSISLVKLREQVTCVVKMLQGFQCVLGVGACRFVFCSLCS